MKKQNIVRFAPSPTGYFHIGNVRTMLVSYLFAKKTAGKFILRFDDTDFERSKKEYIEGIKNDLAWLDISYDEEYYQSSRYDLYYKIFDIMLEKGLIYEAYETPEELNIKRKIALNDGIAPIYDRHSLSLTDIEKEKYIKEGRKPHYRYRMKPGNITWVDLVKGPINFQAEKISDPVIMRADKTVTYILASVIDDVWMNITHILRAEDHVSNTAIQVQMFEDIIAIYNELEKKAMTQPHFAHTSLLKTQTGKFSKRIGGFEIKSLKKQGISKMAILSLLAKIGTCLDIIPETSIENLINEFSLENFGKSPANYDFAVLNELNSKLIKNFTYEEIKELFHDSDTHLRFEQDFWEMIKPNIEDIEDADIWFNISSCENMVLANQTFSEEDIYIINFAKDFISKTNEITEETWHQMCEYVKAMSNIGGKKLFLPLRLALTGQKSGPDMNKYLKFFTKKTIAKRLSF